MKAKLDTTGKRAVVLGGPATVTETTITTKVGTCDVTHADIAPYTVGAVCSHGMTAVSGTVANALALLRRKHNQAARNAGIA
jgi:hypothetical protein